MYPLCSQIDQLIHREVIHKTKWPLKDVRDIDIDSNGFVWIASRINGLARFDGHLIQKFNIHPMDGDPLPGGVWDVLMDDQRGILWLTADNLLIEYHLSRGIFKKSRIYDSYPELKLLHATRIHRYKDQLWFTFNQNTLFILFDDGHTKKIEFLDPIKNPKSDDLLLDVGILASLNTDTVQYVIGKKGIVALNTMKWTYKTYPVWSMENITISNISFRDALLLPDQSILIATWGHGVYRYNAANNTLYKLPLVGGMMPQSIQDMTQISDSILYLDTEEETFVLELVQSDDSLLLKQVGDPLQEIHMHYQLNEELFLSGKDQVKLTSMYANQFEHHDVPDDLRLPDMRHIVAAISNNTSIYCLFYKGGGMYEYDIEKNNWSLHPIILPSGPPKRYVEMCFIDSSTIACLGYDLFTFNIETKEVRYINIGDTLEVNGYQHIMRDEDKNLWVGTRNNGVLKIKEDLQSYKRYHRELSPSQSDNYTGWFYPLVQGPGNEIWVRNKYGYSIIHQKTDSVINYFYPKKKQSPFVHVSDVIYDGDFYWTFGTGVAQINAEKNEVVNSWRFAINEPKRLPIMFANKIDDQIFIVDNTSTLFQFIDDSFAIIPRAVGYKGLGLYTRPIKIKGKIWIGHHHGLVSFNPSTLRSTPRAPKAYVSTIVAQDTMIKSYSPFINNESITLSKGRQLIAFTLAAVDFEAADDLRFRYRMDNGKWNRKNVNLEISLLMNDPGWHVMDVQARHYYNTWPSTSYNLRFYIPPYWYQSNWFKIGLALGLLGCAMYLIRRRQRIISERQEQKTKLIKLELQLLRSQMKPHFIFNCLNAIDGFILTKSPREASDLLSKFSKLIRSSLELSREQLIPLSSELEFLRRYLEIERIKKNNAFDFAIQISHHMQIEQCQIPPFLIQPFVENAIKHGVGMKTSGGLIEIYDSLNENEYVIHIVDNGHGITEIKSDNKIKSLAMKITKERLQNLSLMLLDQYKVNSDNRINTEGQVVGYQVEVKFNIE